MMGCPNLRFKKSPCQIGLKDFCKLKEQFLRFRKILYHPENSTARARELDKQNFLGGRDSLAQKNFSGSFGWGVYPVGTD